MPAKDLNIPINKRIKCFVLLSFLVAIINIHLHTHLLHDKNNALDASHVEFHPPSRSSPRHPIVPKVENITTTTPNNTPFKGESSCLKARTNTVPPSNYGKLQPPFINLGFPKMGTSSLHSFFACAGYRAMHYRCGRDVTCAECIRQSVEEGLLGGPFAKCGTADVYSQIDDGSWGHFPQIEYLEQIIRAFPNGTFFVTFRSIEKWYHSLTHWPPVNDDFDGPHMNDGLRDANITGFPSGTGRNLEEFRAWFCTHVQRVRAIVARNHPYQTLVELDIDDPNASTYMANVFDINERCWGHVNVNAKLHPEHDVKGSKPELPWFVHGKVCIEGKRERRMKRMGPLPPMPGVPPWMLMVNDTCK